MMDCLMVVSSQLHQNINSVVFPSDFHGWAPSAALQADMLRALRRRSARRAEVTAGARGNFLFVARDVELPAGAMEARTPH
jgi:hypothetical protein